MSKKIKTLNPIVPILLDVASRFQRGRGNMEMGEAHDYLYIWIYGMFPSSPLMESTASPLKYKKCPIITYPQVLLGQFSLFEHPGTCPLLALTWYPLGAF